ncbi:MAG: hypothetical protein AB8G22_05135, partial [Saprospiraceae bacterium]
VDGIRRGLALALKERTDEYKFNWFLENPQELEKQFSFIISVHLAEPNFTGATKSRLSNEEIQPILEDWLKEAFLSHFSQ